MNGGFVNRCVVWVRLDVDCDDPAEAFGAVDVALDEGALQDIVNETDCAKVVQATTYGSAEVARMASRLAKDGDS